MPQYDEPVELLQLRRPSSLEPHNLWDFWASTLSQSRAKAVAPRLRPVNQQLQLVITEDVTFSGYEGQPVRAWLHRPAGSAELRGIVVRFIGYGGGRGLPHQVSHWTLAGFAELVVDTRGQGGSWGQVGDTPDSEAGTSTVPGFMTRGILSPLDYYYRRVYTDAALAVDAARTIVGGNIPLIVAGESQGGGIALATSALAIGVDAVAADVPFLCDFPRAMAVASEGPYLELTQYLATYRDSSRDAFNTLAFFDAAILVQRSAVPALISVALSDPICPPSSVYAAINSYGGAVDVRVYPFNGHEGGQFHQQAEQLDWLVQTFAS